MPCSCDSRQLSTVGSTSANKPGGVSLWNAVLCTRMADVRLHVTAPTRGLTRLAPAYRAGIVLKVTAHLACWLTISHPAYPARLRSWSELSWRPSKPRAWKRQPTACAQTTSPFRGDSLDAAPRPTGAYHAPDLVRSHPGMPLRLPADRHRASPMARCGVGPSAHAGNGRRLPLCVAVAGWFCVPWSNRQSRRTNST